MTTYVFSMPPSTNNLFAGKSRRYLSKGYKVWREEAGWQLARQRPIKIAGDVEIHYRFGPRNPRADLCNYEKAPTDLLVAHGVIEDDRHVVKAVLEWADDVVGCEVTVTKATMPLHIAAGRAA